MRSTSWPCAVALMVCLSAGGVPVSLVSEGQPRVTIVIPATSIDRVKAAAADLRHYIRALSGVTVPLLTDGGNVRGPAIYIGDCDGSRASDKPRPGANPETYAIRLRDGDLYLTGTHPTPACFAVMSFIEEELGVRWFAPGELWEYVPTGTPGELRPDVRPREVTPTTSPRVWSGHDWGPTWREWNLRNKTVLSEVVPRRDFQNRLHTVFPPAKYGDSHPEYFPLENGERWIPQSGSHWRPCESNPEVIRLTTEFARSWFDSRPTTDSFSLGMDDIAHLCSCSTCRSWDPRPDSFEKRQFSDRHYRFVNTIAREISPTHPDRYIGTLIYNVARDLPETIPKLEDNVFGYITETCALWWREGQRDADHELSREWAKRCRHLSRYDYYGMGTLTPRFYPHAMDEQIKFDKSLGFEGMYIEVYTFLPHTAPMIWGLAKLQWNHTLSIDDLLHEFYTRMYPGATGAMRRYFALLERSWNTPRPGRDGWVHRSIVRQALAMDPADVDAAFLTLDEATKAAHTDAERTRIGIHRDALRFSSFPIYAHARSRSLAGLVVNDEPGAWRAVAAAAELCRLSAEREEVWAAVPLRDDLLGRNVRGLTQLKPYMPVGQVGSLENGGLPAVVNALDWFEQHRPAALPRALALLTATETGMATRTLRSWLWVKEKRPPNLVRNGSFEAKDGDATKAELDWVTDGCPPGWSKWSRTSRAGFQWGKGVGRDGTTGIALGHADSACYVYAHPVEPGQSYLGVVWARNEAGELGGTATFSIRFRDANGSWHTRRDLDSSCQLPRGVVGWQPLGLTVTVPEGAGGLVLLLGAGGQADSVRALFDDASLHLLPPQEE